MLTLHRQYVSMPRRSASVLPTGCLSIDESTKEIKALVLRFEKDGKVVSQLEMNVADGNCTKILLKSIDYKWDTPLEGVTTILSVVEVDDVTLEEDKPPPTDVDMTQHTLEKILDKCESVISEEVIGQSSDATKPDTFQAALNALPNISTPRPKDIDDVSVMSFDEGNSFARYLAKTSTAKRYELNLRKDGGMTADMSKSLTEPSEPQGKAHKRNVFVTKIKSDYGDAYILLLSKTRPKSSVDMLRLPSSVDMSIGRGRSPNVVVSTAKTFGYTDDEMNMLKQIREVIVHFYSM
uniref:Uncharacterized protein n=1 Tax=viral metagenome TaxID=1070528 RepID=A0A2V0RB30_9ZZZZ